MAIPEVTPHDQKLLKEIEELHVKMQAETSKSSRTALRAQIMEKQERLSSKVQPAPASDSSTLIQPSDDKERVLMQQVQVLSNFMMSTPLGPARKELLKEMKLK